MIPISDENPTIRTPVVTYALLAVTVAMWVLFQGAGLDAYRLAVSVCDYGLVPAELTHGRPIGFAVPIGLGLACTIDNNQINVFTPLISMFLHASWGHLLGNAVCFPLISISRSVDREFRLYRTSAIGRYSMRLQHP